MRLRSAEAGREKEARNRRGRGAAYAIPYCQARPGLVGKEDSKRAWIMNRWIFIAVLGLAACKSGGEDSQAAPPEESAETQEAARREEAASSAPEAPKRSMEEAIDIMTKAIEGSKEGEVGDTHCERAYGGMSKLNQLLGEALEAKEVPEIPREGFLEICGELEEGVQRCMVPSYAMENREECRSMREGLTPEVQERLRSLMRSAR